MNIRGLDYNTQREKLIIPEYGRTIQDMVDYCKTLPSKEERTECAHAIVKIMDIMNPWQRQTANYKQKLWNHLAIMSNFELDIDYPVNVTRKEEFLKKPNPVKYPMQQIAVRHYGHLLEELFEHLKTIPDGEERDRLIALTANQMKRSLRVWNHGGADDEKVADDLARYTDGRVQLDLNSFTFDKVEIRMALAPKSKRSRNK